MISKYWITADGKDREPIGKKLELYIDPIDPKQEALVNVVSG